MIAKLLTDSAWFFFIFWLPIYLNKARGFNVKQIGYYGWVPFAFAAVGAFLGGGLGSLLIRRGWTIDRSRKTALLLSALMMPVALFIVPSPVSAAIVFYSLALFGHQFWSANVQTLAADLFPPGSWAPSEASWAPPARSGRRASMPWSAGWSGSTGTTSPSSSPGSSTRSPSP
jgi:ACS family hexuronate transporter-like MFS transporter